MAHYLTSRTFAAISGANNTAPLDGLFAILAKNGTQIIIEAQDMGKYRNSSVAKGTSKIYQFAKKHGLDSQRLTWNLNYKGYRLIYDGTLYCRTDTKEEDILETIFKRYNDDLPSDYHGRSVSLSDVIELYDEEYRHYFYCDSSKFVPIKFSPALALPMKLQSEKG